MKSFKKRNGSFNKKKRAAIKYKAPWWDGMSDEKIKAELLGLSHSQSAVPGHRAEIRLRKRTVKRPGILGLLKQIVGI